MANTRTQVSVVNCMLLLLTLAKPYQTWSLHCAGTPRGATDQIQGWQFRVGKIQFIFYFDKNILNCAASVSIRPVCIPWPPRLKGGDWFLTVWRRWWGWRRRGPHTQQLETGAIHWDCHWQGGCYGHWRGSDSCSPQANLCFWYHTQQKSLWLRDFDCHSYLSPFCELGQETGTEDWDRSSLLLPWELGRHWDTCLWGEGGPGLSFHITWMEVQQVLIETLESLSIWTEIWVGNYIIWRRLWAEDEIFSIKR